MITTTKPVLPSLFALLNQDVNISGGIMISLSFLKNDEEIGGHGSSGSPLGTKIILMAKNLAVRFEHPQDLPADVLAAGELIAIIVAPGLAQQNIFTELVRINLAETSVKISLFQKEERLIQEYEYPVRYLLDVVKKARKRLLETEGRTDLKEKALEDVKKASFAND